MEQFTDRELIVLWHFTNLCTEDSASVLPETVARIEESVGYGLWRKLNAEVTARGIHPDRLTKRTTVVVTKTIEIPEVVEEDI